MEDSMLRTILGTIILSLTFTVIAVELPPAPVGVAYDLIPDPNLVAPEWDKPWTGPDIPLTFGLQTSTNFPEQVALSPAVRDASFMFVKWVTPNGAEPGKGIVLYGTSSEKFTESASCDSKNYSYALGTPAAYTSGSIFQCAIGPLKPKTKYYYQIQGGTTVYNFTTLPELGSREPLTFGLMADVGQTVNSSTTFDHLAAAEVDFVIFAGDLTYADNYKAPGCTPFKGPGTDRGPLTCGEGGVRWDSWGRLAQKVFSHTPATYCPGNHENEFNIGWGEREPFKTYLARVPALLDDYLPFGAHEEFVDPALLLSKTRAWPPSSPLYYSLDIGSVHIIALSSYSAFTRYTRQDNFLKEDLCAINKEVTPWLIVFSHTPWYNSDLGHYLEGEPFRVMFESYLYNSSADIVIAGHVHAYERSHPVYDMRVDQCGPTYVTVGDGGNDEGIAGPFLDPQPHYSAYREESFGYAELSILSEKKAVYTWYRNQNSTRIPGDTFELENKYYKCGPKKPSFCLSSSGFSDSI